MLGSRKKHDYKIRAKFGIGLRQYEALFEEQGGRCYLCHKECSTKQNLAIDHDHKTGKVRRLLCHNCNTALGHFFDSIEVLERAIEYLQTDFTLPVDEEEPRRPTRIRRAIVKTPNGYFPSFKEAGRALGVDETSVAIWCGRRGSFKRSGFEFKLITLEKEQAITLCWELNEGHKEWNENLFEGIDNWLN